MQRVLTPYPILSNKMSRRRAKQYENAEKFIENVATFFTNTRESYKFALFAYMTLLVFFVFVVDSEYYDLNEIGNEVFALVIIVELGLGISCLFAISGIVNRRALFLGPLLFLQVFVLLYGISHYVCPTLFMKQNHVELEYDARTEDDITWIFCAKLILFAILRMSPLFIQFMFTTFTVRVVVCLMILQNLESEFVLPVHHISTPNSHIWSSIRRKIQIKKISEEGGHFKPKSLTSPVLLTEMSAKFRNAKYPQRKSHDMDIY